MATFYKGGGEESRRLIHKRFKPSGRGNSLGFFFAPFSLLTEK
jgi:hypothetical protein